MDDPRSISMASAERGAVNIGIATTIQEHQRLPPSHWTEKRRRRRSCLRLLWHLRILRMNPQKRNANLGSGNPGRT